MKRERLNRFADQMLKLVIPRSHLSSYSLNKIPLFCNLNAAMQKEIQRQKLHGES